MSDSSSSTNRAPGTAGKRPRLPRWPRILLLCRRQLISASLLVPRAWAFCGCVRAAKAALPQLDGDVQLAGLSAPVIVRRDAHGVPHIEAATEADLFVAQGYVTAQDRLWQMDASRRAANGDSGRDSGSGHRSRTTRRNACCRFASRPSASTRQSPAADRAILDDYTRGVNLYIAQCEKSNTLPPEFRLLGYRPEPWTGVDSVSVGLMMVETLDSRMTTKLSRAHVEAKLNDPQLVADFIRSVPGAIIRPPASRSISAPRNRSSLPQRRRGDEDDDDENTESPRRRPDRLYRVRVKNECGAPEDPAAMLALQGPNATCEGCAVGSNNWVVAGSRTTSGKPLLSNDMHLTLRVPDTWYMADLRAPGFHAAGVTLPGLPLIVAGHNEHVAWGFTALYADVQDLYTEKLDGKGNYEGNDAQWHPLAVDHETIHVRGGRDVVVDVQSTEHGPLLESASVSQRSAHRSQVDPLRSLAQRAPALRNECRVELEGVLGRARAMELAHTESGLCRRSGPCRLPRHRQGSDTRE